MSYNPLPVVHTADLPRYVYEEFKKISLELKRLTGEVKLFEIVHVAPAKVEDGNLVYADGTSWNPGSGAGLYERRGGAWHKL